MERRSQGFHSQNSDEEEDEESYQARRRGASVDDFLRGSELGRQVWQLKWLPYHATTGIRGKCQHWMFRSVVLAYVFVFSHNLHFTVSLQSQRRVSYREQSRLGPLRHHGRGRGGVVFWNAAWRRQATKLPQCTQGISKREDISQYPNDILVCMALTSLISSRFKTGGSTPSSSQLDRESYRKPSHRGPQPQRRPLTVPSIGQCSPSKRQASETWIQGLSVLQLHIFSVWTVH